MLFFAPKTDVYKRQALNRAFKIEVPNEVYENLLEELQKYED